MVHVLLLLCVAVIAFPLYYAFVIGCATQTADVNTVSPAMRRTTLIHGVIAFAFTTILSAAMWNVRV